MRPAADFEARHRPSSANVPLEELDDRVHELPPSGTRLVVFDADPDRARLAADLLAARGRWSVSPESGHAWLRSGPTATGPSAARLWRPHALLEEAIPILATAWRGLAACRAVDLACGAGRDAVHLALQGVRVDAIDVLPDALERAAALARRCRVELHGQLLDLERDWSPPAAHYDLVVVFNFLHRPLFDRIRTAVRPGGFVLYETYLAAQRARYGKPARDAHLLRPGELRAAFGDWEAWIDREGEAGPRRIVASLLARRPPAGDEAL